MSLKIDQKSVIEHESNLVRKFEGKDVNIATEAKGKEWLCGKDVCEILRFENANNPLLNQVKMAYKTNLKSGSCGKIMWFSC